MSKELSGGDSGSTHEEAAAEEPAQVAPDELAIGTRVGRYVVLRRLGSGGMGVVYVAFDPELDREVALKLLRPSRSRDGADGQRRLFEEAQALARLSHPNVVVVYDVGEWLDRVYVALEYVEGRTLDVWCREEQPSWSRAVEVLVQAGHGLAAAHGAGIVHLDFKPGNVLVGADGVARVLDFGLARRRGVTESRDSAGWSESTRPAKVVGTPGFIAPESYLGGEPGPAADQFAFCVTAWQLLFGERPFDGDSYAEIRERVLRGDVDPPVSRRRVPRWLIGVLRRGLSPQPEDRHPHMNDLLGVISRDRRRRGLGVAAAGAIPLVALGLYAYARNLDRDAQLCTAGSEKIVTAWNEDQRQAMRDAFNASGELYARRALEAVSNGLEEYAMKWTSAYADACEATRVRGEQSEALLDLRMQCLEERRQSLGALVDVLARADARVVEQAPTALDRLPRIEPCAERESLLLHPVPELGPDERVRFDAMTAELAAIEALELTDAVDEGLARAQTALAEAQSLGAGAHEARAQLTIAAFLERRGDYDGALEATNRAWFAADASGADEARFLAGAALVWFHGHHKADYEEARWFVSAAREVLGRLSDNGSLELLLLANQAGVAVDEGQHSEAIATYESILEAEQKQDARPSYQHTVTLNNLAGAHFWLGEYEEALAGYESCREQRVELLGAQHPYVGDVLCNIAMTRHALGHAERAYEDLRRCVELVGNAQGPTENALRTVHNNLAVVLQELGRFDEAAEYYRKSLDGWRAAQPDHPAVGALLMNLAELDNERTRYAKAELGVREALRVFEASKLDESHLYFGFAFATLGRAMVGQGRAAEARPHLQRSVLILGAHGSDPLARGDASSALADALAATDAPAQDVETARGAARAAYEEAGPRGAKRLAKLPAPVTP